MTPADQLADQGLSLPLPNYTMVYFYASLAPQAANFIIVLLMLSNAMILDVQPS